MNRFIHNSSALPHVLAIAVTLTFAWAVSQTPYLRTGLQFVAPLFVLMGIHMLWLALHRDLNAGFSSIIYKRTASSAAVMAFGVLALSILAPMPATAGNGGIFSGVLTVLFCSAIIAIVLGIIAVAFILLGKLFKFIVFPRDHDDNTDTKRHDFGSLALGAIVLGGLSLEGLPQGYSFTPSGQSTATYHVNATPERLWQTMETSTNQDARLPALLTLLPQPVDVVVDQGSKIDAIRQVAFQGREGTGHLTLQVTVRDETQAVFSALSDTTPIANWVTHKHLTYRLAPSGTGTILSVTLDYDRRLAPAWFFNPLLKVSTYLAMDVLARDVKSRAET